MNTKISFSIIIILVLILFTLVVFSTEISRSLKTGDYLIENNTHWRIISISNLVLTIQSGTIVKRISPISLLSGKYIHFPI